MFCLHLFGSPQLTKPVGEESTSVPLERFALAILALLAAAAPRGLTRDRVLALLWPEVDAPRARHSLAQLRYALRKTLGVDPIIGTTDLRLDASIMAIRFCATSKSSFTAQSLATWQLVTRMDICLLALTIYARLIRRSYIWTSFTSCIM